MAACDLCGAPSNGYECDWPLEQFISAPATSIVIGDTVTRMSQARKTSSVAKVSLVEVKKREF